ncbi:ATP-binding protein [Streptomyces sulfonofaciens]|uniref:ATP-binding protein n=1 Tax=Streptomyces sulfonofaciens TaxID=68272 RepID=A0A919L6R6_9ACTN|nr:ATP-binding protein [Streptomyces sulfonofaciens]GHH84776.1 ATP-binding protein [Streptomyces sulfonofaciens]
MFIPPAQVPWRIALPRTAAAVPMARAVVRSALKDMEHTTDSDTAELLTAELVANAVEHTTAEGPIELVVAMLPGRCQVEVHDCDPAPPGSLGVPGPIEEPDPWQEHGRGLVLLRTLSSSCGHRPTDRGKAVWFTLSCVPRQQRRHPAQTDVPLT